MTDTLRMTLLPMGTPDRRALDDLAQDLKGMSFDVELVGRRSAEEGLDAVRGQFQAGAILSLAGQETGERVIAITDVGLHGNKLNVVFGIAQPRERTCVISLFRLHLGADGECFRSYALKEAMHEPGMPLASATAPIRVALCGSAICWRTPTARAPPTVPAARRSCV